MESIELRTKQRVAKVWHQVRGEGRVSWLRAVGLAVAGLALASGAAARAQNTGSVFGTVQDKTGAAVPKATVTIADTDHGINRVVQSNGTGEFLITQLPVGNYILSVTAPTFETAVVTDIKVDANTNIKEVVSLASGAATDTITVEDTQGSTVDAKSAQLATLIDQKLIEDLPIDGHNIVALSALLPGVTDVNAPTTFTGDTNGPTYSASGSRNTQNLMLFDGLMWNNLFYNTGINYPSPNALQEVSVILNNYKAQYGRNAGSVFNVITKKGGNAYHGAVWDYIQNQYFNASDYISKTNPKDNVNQLGFTVGGPIVKDKLFFFAAFQDLIGRLQTTGVDPLPGLAERGLSADGKTPRPCSSNGPFGGLSCASFLSDVTLNGVPQKLINPIEVAGTSGAQANPSDTISMYNSAYAQAGGTGQSPCIPLLNTAANYAASNVYLGTKIQPTYLPNAEIPVQCLNPVIENIFNTFIPIGNGGQSVTSTPAPTGDKNALLRFDYQLNGQNSFDVRYNYVHSNAIQPPGVNKNSVGIANYANVNSQAHSNFGNVGWTWVISPSLLNQMRVGYKRYESAQYPLDNRTLNSFGGNLVVPGTPTLPVISISNTFTLGSTSQGYQDHINENVEVLEQLSYTRGNHNFLAGFNFLRLQYLTRSDNPGQESFSTSFTGLGLADASLGLLTSIQAQNRLIQGGIQHDVFTYLQDDWRITSKLTLNLGARYELPFQWFEPHGQSATFIPGIQSTVFPSAPGGLGFPGDKQVLPSLVPTDFNGIAPRVGFAYDTTGTGKFLIRGGYGIFFDAVNANVVGVGEPYHFIVNETIPATDGGASDPLAFADPVSGGRLTIPGQYVPGHAQFIAPYSLFFPDPHFRTPYAEAVNFGFQYHIPKGGVLDANYVGKFAHKLTIPLDLNPAIYSCDPTNGYYQADPARYCTNASSNATSTKQRVRYAPFNYGGQGIVDILSVGNSNYHALQVQYTQRGGKLLTILSSYTYSKSIDLQTNGQTTSNTAPDVFSIKSERGLSDTNSTHNFKIGWVERFPKFTGGDGLLRSIINDWVYSGSYIAYTGHPYTVTINNDTALVGEPGQRASIVGGLNPVLPSSRHRSAKVAEYFNIEAFTYPEIGTFSSVGRNTFTGPAYILTDMTIGRDFPLAHIREGMRMNFRAEGFNVFNTPNLAAPYSQFSCSSTSISTTTLPGVSCDSTVLPNGAVNSTPGSFNANGQFGRVLSTIGNNSNNSTNGRKLQFALTIFY